MFYNVGNILSPLYPLLSLIGWLFSDTDDDDPDNGDLDSSDEGQTDELDDDQDDLDDDEDDDDFDDDEEEGDDDDEDDDLDDDLDQEELNGRNADKAISRKDAQVEATLMSMVKTMVKYPDTAEDTIADLQSEQPDLAKRLAKMYEGQKNTSLRAALKDAPEEVRSVLSKLVDDMESIKAKSEKDRTRDERRIFKEWQRVSHPYLDPKSELGKTKLGKTLRKEFARALDRLPDDQELDLEMLEDALAIAKRRSKWNDSRMSDSAKKQAKEQAQKARSGAVAGGKSKKSDKASTPSPSSITQSFNQTNDPERQKKVEEAKRKKFPHLYN